jgi:voltage-gated potassium channel
MGFRVLHVNRKLDAAHDSATMLPERPKQLDIQMADMRRRLRTAGIGAFTVLLVGSTGYYLLDTSDKAGHRLLDSIYMTVITLTTVGYEEIIPLDARPWGRIFTMVLLVFGFAILAYFASTLTAFLVEGQIGHVFRRQRMDKAIEALREHYIVCGDRVVAAHVIDELRRTARPVVAVVPVGSEPPPVTTTGDLLFVEGDPADEEVLREAGIMRAAGVFAAMESDRDNVLVTLTARQTNPILRIVSMLIEPRNESKLRRAGADGVVSPPRIGGLRMASEMVRPMVATFLDAMLRDQTRNLRIEEMSVGAGSPAIGQRVGALRLNERPDLLLLALVEPGGGATHFKPDEQLVIEQGAVLIVMGGPQALGRLRKDHGGADHALNLTTTGSLPVPKRT